MKTNFKIAYLLSAAITLIAAIASAGGLFIRNLYQDTETIKTAWKANDIITLLVVVPLLILSMDYSKRGSERGYLLWMGLLGYIVYSYAFYLFGAAFNVFFLLYVSLVSLSIYALVLGLSACDLKSMVKHFSNKTPVRWISIFLLFISLPLVVVEAGECIRYVVTGKPPDAPVLVFALDLSIVVPNSALAAILLWKRKTWGYVLATIMVVKAFTYGLVLTTATTLITFNLAGPLDPLMPFYIFVAVGGLFAAYALLYNQKPQNNSQ